ncbi:MAG: hypothetical protein BroJett030_28860 [Alphaproteobacteria bacterium]|nr:MAG: hypothetical protein BroJett030_28860 [Alphaproteobacteria bacterium]
MAVHRTTAGYWKHYHALPAEIRALADKNFELLKHDPRHPSLRFKRVGEVWSVRVGIDHRAVALPSADGYDWFWIGGHAEYDRLIRKR